MMALFLLVLAVIVELIKRCLLLQFLALNADGYQHISHSLQNASLPSLILPLEIDIRYEKIHAASMGTTRRADLITRHHIKPSPLV